MQLTLRQIEAFLTVANLRSFTAAGASLHITQSAVSNLIKDLEAQVGVPLFDRTSRFVSLSPDGRELYTLAQKAFHEFLLMEKYAADLSSLRSGRVRIVARPSLPAHCCPCCLPILKKASRTYGLNLLINPWRWCNQAYSRGMRRLALARPVCRRQT